MEPSDGIGARISYVHFMALESSVNAQILSGNNQKIPPPGILY